MNDVKELVETYKRALNTAEGDIIINDLENFALMDEQVGSQLSHAECAYRNGMQDLVRYIKALITEK